MQATLPTTIRRLSRSLTFILLAVALAGCTRQPLPYAKRVDRDPNLLLVYAACALQPTVEAAASQFETENPGKSVRIETGEPLDLVRRIQDGDVPDLFICPGEAEIGLLEREGHLDRGSRHALRSLRLVVAVPAGNPARVHRVRDLLSERVSTIAMSLPGFTSPGDAGKHALDRAGLYSQIQDKLVLKETPLAALEMLAAGEADAGILYDPCLRLSARDDIAADAVEVAASLAQEEDRRTNVYVVEHKRSPNSLLAQRLIRILTEGPAAPAAEEPGAEETPPAGDIAPAE